MRCSSCIPTAAPATCQLSAPPRAPAPFSVPTPFLPPHQLFGTKISAHQGGPPRGRCHHPDQAARYGHTLRRRDARRGAWRGGRRCHCLDGAV
eukprot:scaffold220343_cov25-Tisochrysis_lutea.AAC.6